MISAQELRTLQAQFLTEDRLTVAAEFYYRLLMEEAQKSIAFAQQTNRDWVFLNYVPLIQPIYGFYYTMFLEKALERVEKELSVFGYRLENISDPSKSNKLFIKLSW